MDDCCVHCSSCAIGFLAGVITANPLAGIGVGCAVGAAIGTFTAAEIIAAKYDVNYNRAVTCIFVIGGSAAAGALGGFIGYWASGASIAVEVNEVKYFSEHVVVSSDIEVIYL